MKHNLKTFPETPVCATDDDRLKHFANIINWKFAFEKELREILNKDTRGNSQITAYIDIKTVLGES